MLKYLVVYRTKKGELKEHLLDFPISREIGEVTNNGWLVIDIQVFYKGEFIKLNDFNQIIEKEMKEISIKRKKEVIKKQKIMNNLINIENKINKFFERL